MIKKECEFCGKEFLKKVSTQKYCSPECSREVLKTRIRKKRKDKKQEDWRKQVLQCKFCGGEFLRSERRRAYCCDFCRESAKLEREEKRRERIHRMENTQPCWTCKNYIDGCNWSRDFTPVPGWVAERVLRIEEGEADFGYRIEYCPEYDYDGS